MKLTEVDQQSARLLLEDFLNTPSINGTAGELLFAEKICAYLQKAGLNAQLDQLDEKRANVLLYVPGSDRSRNIVLNGHLDTVKYGDLSSWNTPPESAVLSGGRLFARGAADMKAGLAGMVFILAELSRKSIRPPVDIWFVASCDEEAGGAGASACLEKEWLKKAGFILVGEPTSLKLGLCEKACNWLRFIVHGKTGHGAYPERGVNAIEHGFAILERVKAQIEKHIHPLLGASTMQITQLSAGIAPNMTPDRAEFVLDIRNTPTLCNESVFDLLKKESAAESDQTAGLLHTEIEIINSRPPLESSPSEAWIQAFNKSFEKVMGRSAYATGVSFFTDASLFVQANHEAPILLFGPGEPDLCHQANESVKLKQYEQYLDILMTFLTDNSMGT